MLLEVPDLTKASTVYVFMHSILHIPKRLRILSFSLRSFFFGISSEELSHTLLSGISSIQKL